MTRRYEFDDRDAANVAKYTETWNKRPGPRVGDFVHMLDGTTRRFTHDWGEDIQTTCKGEAAVDASFYFGDGYASFSGSLDRAIMKSTLEQTPETRKGWFWTFHHAEAGAGRGVSFEVECRVFKQLPG